MATDADRPSWLLLDCAVQNYAWGKKGNSSVVAKFKSSSCQFKVEPDQPYAELWMGTHKKGPSTILAPAHLKGNSLKDWLSLNTWALGNCARHDIGLPFLFKVLSIAKPLSIQAHPTKQHAEQLHSSFPDKYPDPNHKPEMAIAVSEFEAFCGFRCMADIALALENVPELQNVVGEQVCRELLRLHHSGVRDGSQEMKAALKECFSAYINQTDDIVKTQLSSLVTRSQSAAAVADLKWGQTEAALLLRLNADFPGDVGCFAVYFLNYLKLSPGETIFLAPNEPHAYISGECVECMACSDNVVRAGLTPKFKDRKVLCNMLTYSAKGPLDNFFQAEPHATLPWPDVKVFDPPVPEFTVLSISLKDKGVEIPSVNGPSIVIVILGSLQLSTQKASVALSTGSVAFLPANTDFILKNVMQPQDCLVYQAYCDQNV